MDSTRYYSLLLVLLLCYEGVNIWERQPVVVVGYYILWECAEREFEGVFPRNVREREYMYTIDWVKESLRVCIWRIGLEHMDKLSIIWNDLAMQILWYFTEEHEERKQWECGLCNRVLYLHVVRWSLLTFFYPMILLQSPVRLGKLLLLEMPIQHPICKCVS